jgi:hypothetical protein
VSKSICTFAYQNDKNMTNTQFEQMQFSNEVNQGQDFDSTDDSKVDQYKPHEDFDFQYRDYYDRQDKADN